MVPVGVAVAVGMLVGAAVAVVVRVGVAVGLPLGMLVGVGVPASGRRGAGGADGGLTEQARSSLVSAQQWQLGGIHRDLALIQVGKVESSKKEEHKGYFEKHKCRDRKVAHHLANSLQDNVEDSRNRLVEC